MAGRNESQHIYGFPFEFEDDATWVIEQIIGQIQALGGMVKGSKDNVYVSLPSGVQPEQVSPLHLLDFNVMII
jgi:hypothetical protein